MTDAKRPLEGIILERGKSGIGKYFGENSAMQELLTKTLAQLAAQGVTAYQFGTSFSHEEYGTQNNPPSIVLAQASEAEFFDKGGMLFERGTFSGIFFEKALTGGQLTLSGPRVSEVAANCKRLHIPHEVEEGVLTINGAAGLYAVALSKGRFSGSSQYLAQHGYTDRST